MPQSVELKTTIRGQCRLGTVTPRTGAYTAVPDISQGEIYLPGLWKPHGYFEHNLVMYGAATAIAELLRGAPDLKQYKIGGMLVEFENNGGAAVTPPSNTDRSNGTAYYAGLSSDPNRDYLRVPLTAQSLESTDDSLYPEGNKLVNFAQTTGIAGVHGKTFSHTVSSRVYGGALAVFPVANDSTQDIIFSRFYFTDSDNQLVKQNGSQISLTWPLTLQ